MGRIKTIFASEDREVVASFQKAQKELTALGDKFAALQQKQKQQNQEQQTAFQRGTAAIGNQVRQYASLQGAVALVNRELQRKLQLEKEALQTTLSVADAEIKALRNLGPASAQRKAQLRADVAQISGATGVQQKDIFLAYSDALSAKGNLSDKAVKQAVSAAAKLAPESPEELRLLSGAALDLAKVGGSTNAEANLGFLASVGGKARVTSSKFLAQNVSPAIAGVQAFGSNRGEAGALVAALTQAAQDPTGAVSGTGAIKIAEQLRSILPGEGVASQIGKLQGDEKLRRDFLDNLSIEAKLKPFVEQLVSNADSAIAKEFSANLQALPQTEQAAGRVFASLVDRSDSPFQQVAEASRRGQVVRESEQVGGGRAAFVSDQFEKGIEQSGMLERVMARGFYRAGKFVLGQELAARTALEALAQSRSIGLGELLDFATAGPAGGALGVTSDKSSEAQVRHLRNIEKLLRETREQPKPTFAPAAQGETPRS